MEILLILRPFPGSSKKYKIVFYFLEYGNRTVYRNTEIKTIYLYRFHSNPIRDIFGGKTRRKGMEWGKEFNGTTRNFAI